jgi:hypothetical protein
MDEEDDNATNLVHYNIEANNGGGGITQECTLWHGHQAMGRPAIILITDPNGGGNWQSNKKTQIIIDGITNPQMDFPKTDEKEVELFFEVLNASDQIEYSNYLFDFWVTGKFFFHSQKPGARIIMITFLTLFLQRAFTCIIAM